MPVDRATVARWRANLQGEVDGATLYRAMAARPGDERLAELYVRMAEAEERHAALWRERLTGAGLAADLRPSWRARTLAVVARRFGAGLVAPTVADQERRGQAMYDDQPEAAGTSLPEDERSHARLLHSVTGGASGATLARFEGRHKGVGGNALRAAVLGANDGLVSNLSLVMGVAGATSGGSPVLIAGVAGLLAGSLSMALGEWLSVQSARELYANQIATESEELSAFPEEEAEELRLIYEAKGLEPVAAKRLADRIIGGDASTALDTMAREELGIDPHDLGGSAWTAAITSFVLFSLGAIIPVVPFLVASGGAAIVASAALSGLALFGLGAAITVMTGRPALISGIRQLAFGLVAAAITFGVGALLGTTIG
ncbi:MAG: VIT1/CCC1 transporter family protein [Chloroflexota bacterium]